MLETAAIFGDHMVLQQGKPVKVWGRGNDGVYVEVMILGKNARTMVKDGRWEVRLPALEAAAGAELIITAGTEKLTFKDVAVGEVWLAGGQSNMEFWMPFESHYREELPSCENDSLRFFECPKVTYDGQTDDFDYSDTGFWRTCNADHLKFFSAVGYYMAKNLQKDLKVPVGIICCNWGGTQIGSWMREDYLERHGSSLIEQYRKGLDRVPEEEKDPEKIRKNPLYDHGKPYEEFFNVKILTGISREEQLQMVSQGMSAEGYLTVGPYSPNCPSRLYHSMVEGLAPYTLRGILWYQGESDCDHADLYKDLFRDFVENWRETWQDQLPFITVQLAPFGNMWNFMGGDNYPVIRQAQAENAKELEKVYMVSSSDVGMEFDIHPKNKKPIGERMAWMALNKVYGENIPADAPEISDLQVEEDRLVLSFQNAGDGLFLDGVTRKNEEYLKIYVDEKEAEIQGLEADGSKLIVYVKTGRKNRVAFARSAFYKVNLYNSAGIPALPFECTKEV